jgi:hypothetical protein
VEASLKRAEKKVLLEQTKEMIYKESFEWLTRKEKSCKESFDWLTRRRSAVKNALIG